MIHIHDLSPLRNNICIFRINDQWQSDMKPVVWISQPSAQNHNVRCSWEEAFSIYCAQGDLFINKIRTGDIVTADADPASTQKNTFALSYADKLYSLTPAPGASPGALHITTDSTVQNKMAYIGFSIDGNPVCAQWVYQNMNYSISPKTKVGLLYANLDAGHILELAQWPNAYLFDLDPQRPERYFTLTDANIWQESSP